MSRRNKPETIIEKLPGELIMQLASMANFPQEKAAVEVLAKALERAATETGLRMQAILDDILAGGAWCPTPYDIRALAGAMKDRLRERREGDKRAKWREQYGEPNPQWARDLLAKIAAPTGAEQRARLHEEAIRAMLYYTEGEGRTLGDREFWEGPRKDGKLTPAQFDARDHAALVIDIRQRGGWRTEAELRGPMPPRATV